MKGYTDLDQFNGDLKILQHLDVNLPPSRMSKTVIVQNVNINEAPEVKAHNFDGNPHIYGLIFGEINRLGSMKEFIKNVYQHAIDYYGNKRAAANALGLNKNTLIPY